MTAEQAAEAFLRHRKVTEQLCGLMADDRFDFRAYEGGFTFGQLATHLANSGDFFISSAEGVPYQRPDPAQNPATPAAVREYLARKTREQADRIRGLGDDLDRPVEFRGVPMPVGLLLARMREHEAHHKGQMMFLARMAGVKDELFYVAR